MLNQRSLVLEGVTLAQVVELVVKVLVDLTAGTVLDQQTTEDTEAAHPHNLAEGNTLAKYFQYKIVTSGFRSGA